MKNLEKRKKIDAQRRMIIEMIEAAMQKAKEKGPHQLKLKCNCIACINKRKRILDGPLKPWRYRL
jgi:hypothetical protein